MRMNIKRGSRVSTDKSGFIGVVTAISGTVEKPVYTVKTAEGKLVKPAAWALKLTRGKVPGKNYGKPKAKKATKIKAKPAKKATANKASKPAPAIAAKPKRSHKKKVAATAAPIITEAVTSDNTVNETEMAGAS